MEKDNLGKSLQCIEIINDYVPKLLDDLDAFFANPEKVGLLPRESFLNVRPAAPVFETL